jgi:uridylate kinase
MSQKYKRILLKLSGEALMGSKQYGQDPNIIESICKDIAACHQKGYEVCLVIGGGNICRGASLAAMGLDRATGDYMGMLATVINALAFQSVLEGIGVATRVQSAITMTSVCEPYIRRRAIRHMEKRRVVIFAAGVGSPFFTTDTCAALRAVEMSCDVILKGTQVDGVYSDDPVHNKNAERFTTITYQEVITRNLKVMDGSAIALARDNKIPIIVFNIHQAGALGAALNGENNFTLIEE